MEGQSKGGHNEESLRAERDHSAVMTCEWTALQPAIRILDVSKSCRVSSVNTSPQVLGQNEPLKQRLGSDFSHFSTRERKPKM